MDFGNQLGGERIWLATGLSDNDEEIQTKQVEIFTLKDIQVDRVRLHMKSNYAAGNLQMENGISARQ